MSQLLGSLIATSMLPLSLSEAKVAGTFWTM
jgi:hypothetical protein